MQSTETVITMAQGSQSTAHQIGSKDDISAGGFIRLAPKTHDISLASEHIPNFSRLTKDLNSAVQAAWPHRHGIRYKKVEVLLLRWADDDLGVLTELEDLEHVFVDLYFYNVQKYDIPSEKPDNALTRRVLDFLDQDGEETLFILYYAGHGRNGSQYDEGTLWYANRSAGSPYLPARGIQSKFEEAYADTLLLYDCCNSAATTTSPSCRGHKGVTEVMAACGYEAIAAEVGEHSFSNALIQVLASASKDLPISVAEIHSRVVSRLKCWSPSLVKDDKGQYQEDQTGRLARERVVRKTPIYGILCETVPRRSIALGPLKSPNTPSKTVGSLPSDCSSLIQSDGTTASNKHPTALSNPRKRKFSEIDTNRENNAAVPQILLAIRLDTEEIDVAAWKECLLRQLPSEVQEIKIEGVYKSFSTLLLLSVPLSVWDLLPSNTAYSFIGFVTSDNLAFADAFHTKGARIPTLDHGEISPAPINSKMEDLDGLNMSEDAGHDSPSTLPIESSIPEGVVRMKSESKPPIKSSLKVERLLETEMPKTLKSNHFSGGNELSQTLPLEPNPKQAKLQQQDESTSLLLTKQLGEAEMCRLEAINPPFAGTTHLGVIQTGSFQSAYVNPTKEKHKKPRASKPKIKPGCVTCRARRVKCDETKPHCLRCQKFGRLCDGYVPVTQNRTHQSQPRIFTAHSRAIPYSPSVSIHTTEEEFRYFQIFIERPAHEIPGFFDASLWTHIIPQASHTFESIRHSVNSLGALYKAFEEAPGPNLKVIVIQAIGKKHREQAILQHLRAIQALNKYITCSASPQLRVALLANLLFICFETLQEEHASAVQQLVGGLKILRSYYSGQPRSTPWIPALKNHSDTLSHKKLCTAFVNWQKDVSLARDRAIANYVEEYLEGVIVHQVPHADSQDTLQFPKNKSTGTVSTPNEIQQIPSPRSTGEDPELDTADFQKHYSLFLGLAKDKVEESPGEDQRHMDDSISSTSQDGASSYPTSRRPSTTFSVSTNISAGTRTTLSTMPRLYPSSTMGVSDHDVSRQSGSEARTGPLEPYHTTHPGPILHNDEKIEETLVRTFMRLDGSSTFFGMVPGIPPLKWDVQNAWSDPIPAAPFKDIPSAHLCWDSIMDRALSFYRRINFNQNYYPFLQDSVENVRDEQAMFLQQLNDFRICFTPILEESLTSKPDEIANPVALLISIYWRLVRMLLDSLLSETEMIYDNYFPDFEYIVKTCNQLASSPSTVYLQDSSRFSLEVGIIPALHFTATKCRDPVIRRDAIALLFAHPKEEGFYDGVLSARIGRWIAACEEDGLSIGIPDDTTPPSSPSGNALDRSQPGRTIDCDNEEADQKKFIRKPPIIPEENRVKLIVVDYHISERYLKARCQKVLPGSDGKREERDTVIAW